MTDGRDPSEDFVALIDKALDTFDNNQNLPRQRAQIYLHFHQKDKAVDLYRKLLKRNASRFSYGTNLPNSPTTRTAAWL